MKKQLLKRTEVEEVTSLSRSTIYAAMDIGDFPHPVKVGKRAVRWRSADVEDWIASRPTTADRPA